MGRCAGKLISLGVAAVCCGVPLSAYAALSAQAEMDKAYGDYDKKLQCWVAEDDENGQRYCMKIDRADSIAAATGQRLYILAAGEAVDAAGEPNGSHVTPGLVGAFVIEEHAGKAELLAGDAKIYIGSNGFPPTGWKLTKLGPADYWGWQNISGDCHQGYCGSRYSILAPYGSRMRDLAPLAASFDDAGACVDDSCADRNTVLDSKLEIDTTQNGEGVYPLLITVTGQDKGKALAPKTWRIPFDLKKWSFIEPVDWPLKDADF